MAAVVQDRFGGPEVLELREIERPEPTLTEVRVRVHAAGVNPVDVKTRRGRGVAAVVGPDRLILGWDVSGTVDMVGPGVTRFRPGDEVYGMPLFPRRAGAYAEYVVAPSRQFAPKPTSLTHLRAGGAPLAMLTAWQTLVDVAQVRAGQRVLIHAAGGGVGHLAVQLAHHLGAEVIGTASPARHDWLRALGAAELIDYTSQRFEDVVDDVDVVVDLVGDAVDGYSTRSLSVLRPGGLLVVVPGSVPASLAAAADQSGVRVAPFTVEPDGHALTELSRIIDQSSMSVEVERSYPLDQVRAAHQHAESGHTRGKLVLAVS
jgi:NADPH:quinone reductase-like Zn-dependent oxidoreductase